MKGINNQKDFRSAGNRHRGLFSLCVAINAYFCGKMDQRQTPHNHPNHPNKHLLDRPLIQRTCFTGSVLCKCFNTHLKQNEDAFQNYLPITYQLTSPMPKSIYLLYMIFPIIGTLMQKIQTSSSEHKCQKHLHSTVSTSFPLPHQ